MPTNRATLLGGGKLELCIPIAGCQAGKHLKLRKNNETDQSQQFANNFIWLSTNELAKRTNPK